MSNREPIAHIPDVVGLSAPGLSMECEVFRVSNELQNEDTPNIVRIAGARELQTIQGDGEAMNGQFILGPKTARALSALMYLGQDKKTVWGYRDIAEYGPPPKGSSEINRLSVPPSVLGRALEPLGSIGLRAFGVSLVEMFVRDTYTDELNPSPAALGSGRPLYYRLNPDISYVNARSRVPSRAPYS